MNILITDGENRSSLVTCRSLGRRGHNIFVSGKDHRNISSSSAFCRKYYKVTDPSHDVVAYANDLLEIVDRESIEVVFPMTEQSIYCLNRIRSEISEQAILACALSEKMEAVSNKYKLFQLAEHLGVEIPHTVFVENYSDYQEKRKMVISFPVVVKPSFSKLLVGGKILSGSVMYAHDADELDRLYEKMAILDRPSLIQEMIVGEGAGLFTLFDGDKHLVLFSHRRLLEKPPSGGVSVLSESVAIDNGIVEAARKLLTHVGWQGVAMVEFKRDIRDGRAKLMEINGRFWGSLQLAVSAEVDFPTLCLDYYLGKKPASLFADYRVGQRLKWHLGILDHLIIRVKKGDRNLNLPPGTPGIAHVMSELICFNDGRTSYDVYDCKDKRPFYTELMNYIKNILGSKQ
ncbi:MAG: ATP-grasp domain-containing protein [Geobacteraceae bacterium]|nr:ATP-grasp domain-containing protein [Geobacteraceae bacterium]